MWIVRLALRRPYTFVVAALLLLLLTPFVLTKTQTDIFPAINIRVVSVVWSYAGLPADQIAQRIVSGWDLDRKLVTGGYSPQLSSRNDLADTIQSLGVIPTTAT